MGRCIEVYLDDIIIYSDTLAEHIQHVMLAMDILAAEKLYLSRSKISLLPGELKLLGRIIDEDGIRIDPEKVDSVLTWKTPTNRDLLRGFIGSVGFLADDIPNIRIPLGILSAITGDKVLFRWGYTEQRAFDEAKALAHSAHEHSRHPIRYDKGAPQVWMVTDGCSTGVTGVISQGRAWKNAHVAAFYSAKLNSAQRNYPVHEIEMLAGVETMLRHKDILQGVFFKWVTDHKGLIHLLNQKNISGRQARWLEKISSFVFEVVFATGSKNVLADALSRMYSDDSRGTERTVNEYTYHDVTDEDAPVSNFTTPLFAGANAIFATRREVMGVSDDNADLAESSRDFACRMKHRFVLKGPQKRMEGGTTAEKSRVEEIPDGSNDSIGSDAEEADTSSSLPEVLLESAAGIDLFKIIKGRYIEDKVFKSVIGKPRDFRNFKLKDDLLYITLAGKELLCIPKILFNGRSIQEIILSEAHSMLAYLECSKSVTVKYEHVRKSGTDGRTDMDTEDGGVHGG